MRKILVIDDTESMRDLMRGWIEEWGFEVVTANNGKQGLQKIEANSFDLIITNLCMPVMDGFELLEHLKVNPPNIPILVVSGYPNVTERFLLADSHLGADATLQKPFNHLELRVAVHQLLRLQVCHQ